MDFLKISKAIADNTRFDIFREIIKQKEAYCGEITKSFNISQPAISHHIKVLVEANLVIARKEGQYIYLSVNNIVLKEYMNYLKTSFSIKKI